MDKKINKKPTKHNTLQTQNKTQNKTQHIAHSTTDPARTFVAQIAWHACCAWSRHRCTQSAASTRA